MLIAVHNKPGRNLKLVKAKELCVDSVRKMKWRQLVLPFGINLEKSPNVVKPKTFVWPRMGNEMATPFIAVQL